jgi:hypothetical protein
MAVSSTDLELNPDLAYWLEMAEARAYQDIYAAVAAVPGNPLGAKSAVFGGAIAHGLAAIDFFFFNRVVGLGVAQPAIRGDVAGAAAFYRELGLSQTAMHVAPSAQPPELADWMAAEGYKMGGRWVKLWHDLREIAEPAPALRIERVDPSLAEAFADVIIAAFEMPDAARLLGSANVGQPGWIHYLGFEGETPVSASGLRIDGDVAWLGYGSTLPDARGRGWQTAMFLRRLHDARARGCRLAITETGEETEENPVNHSYRNMVRTGFRLAYARRNWYTG